MDLGDLSFKALLDLVFQLLHQLWTIAIVLHHGREGMIVVYIVGRVLHPEVLEKHEQSLSRMLLIYHQVSVLAGCLH